jgi:nucleoside-diphosphate-sugar epimerase
MTMDALVFLSRMFRGFKLNILLTGGMGYIGSHTAVTIIEAGHELLLLDNLSNSD